MWHDKFERVLAKHGVPQDEATASRERDRPKATINAIIRDVQALNAESKVDSIFGGAR